MKSIKKTAFIALGLFLSASVAQALIGEIASDVASAASDVASGAADVVSDVAYDVDRPYRILPYGPVVVNPDDTVVDNTYRIQPYGEPIIHDDNGEVHALPYKGKEPVVKHPYGQARDELSGSGMYRIQPYGPVTVKPEKKELHQSVIVHPGTTTPITTKATPDQVSYQAGTQAQAKCQTDLTNKAQGYIPPVSEEATKAQVESQGTPAQVGYKANVTDKAQGYIPPTISEKEIK